jgi:wyosine [tRNA(Phe)-imidazoG37] synthetase (radical SAM superfamily)
MKNSRNFDMKNLKTIAEIMKKFDLSSVEVGGFKVSRHTQPKAQPNVSTQPEQTEQDFIKALDDEIQKKLEASGEL